MATQKRTPWFSAGNPPVRPGVYNASVCRDPRYFRYWDGKRWSMGAKTPEQAAALRKKMSTVAVLWHSFAWRGLAQQP